MDIDAERSVLAALLSGPDVFADVSEILDPEDFGMVAHKLIYAAIVALEAAGKPIDRITVADQLRKQKHLQKAGGTDTIDALLDEAAGAGNVVEHAQIISDRAKLRRLIAAGREIAGEAMAQDAEAGSVLEHAEQLVFDLGKSRARGSMHTMSQAVAVMLEDLAKARTSSLIGQSTGLAELDKLTGGLQPGQLIVVAARPGMGKSAFALQLARHVAETSGGMMVPFLSYEMSVSELSMRMLANSMAFNLHKLRQGDIPSGMERDLAVAAENMAQLSVLIDDNPPDTMSGVRSAMRRLARRGPIGAIVVDYLQLLSADRFKGGDNRVQEVTEISRGLKRLATELEVPVIALSQLNRQLEQRPNKRPQLSDLRESGSIEQDASLVLFLYRDAMYNGDADPNLAEVIIGKQRNGPTGTIYCEFDAAAGGRFVATAKRPASGGGSLPPISSGSTPRNYRPF